MYLLRKIGLWVAFAISIPGAVLALVVAIPRIPLALLFGVDSFRIPALYLIYAFGMAAGFLSIRAVTERFYVAAQNYGRRTIVSALGVLAASFLEYAFRNEKSFFIPVGYLAFTSLIWLIASVIAWRKSIESSKNQPGRISAAVS